MISVIVNPIAGNGSAKAVAQKAAAFFTARHLDFEILETKGPGDATELAAKASSYADLIVADGGDGTIREITQGMCGSNCPLGVLPGGRGNDFRRSINVPDSIEEALEILVSGQDRRIDLMRVNDDICANIYSFGFDVDVIINSEKFRIFKGLSYYISALYTAFAGKSTPMRITIDGETQEGNVFLVAFGNGGQYGGGMKVLPNAIHGDGWLDVCIVKDVSPLTVLKMLPKFIVGRHGEIKDKVFFYRARQITVETPSPMPTQADGELFSPISHADASIIPGSLIVRVAKN